MVCTCANNIDLFHGSLLHVHHGLALAVVLPQAGRRGAGSSGSGPRLVAGHVLRVHHSLALAVPVRQRATQRIVPQRVRRPARLPRGQVARKAPLRERVSAIARRGRVERVVAPDVDLRPPRGAASAAAHAMCRGTVQRRSAAYSPVTDTRPPPVHTEMG